MAQFEAMKDPARDRTTIGSTRGTFPRCSGSRWSSLVLSVRVALPWANSDLSPLAAVGCSWSRPNFLRTNCGLAMCHSHRATYRLRHHPRLLGSAKPMGYGSIATPDVLRMLHTARYDADTEHT